MNNQLKDKNLRENVFEAVVDYYNFKHKKESDTFRPGDRISYAGRVFDEKEIINLVDSALDFWLTSGRYCEKFEKELASFLDLKYCSLVNSGSSANLLAFYALTSHKLGDRRINGNDEVITVAAGFPTTIAPIIQYGAVPVFVDVKLPTYNIDCTMLEYALSSKTKAVILAHTLGNPFELDKVLEFCNKYNLWLIEDNCDSLGSRYLIDGTWRFTGTIGHIGTSSFYPPHHMTAGEGGAVYTGHSSLNRLIDSFRDWGRDCRCASGIDNTCKRRFTRQFGELPEGYDHKYVYSHFGFNLKATEMQAAVACAQIEKLPGFIEARKRNWQLLKQGLAELEDILILPEATCNSDPSWFGFLITVRRSAPFSRDSMVSYLENCNIQTRMLFAGNILKQPCFDRMRSSGTGYRIAGELKNTDMIMNNSFWIGVYPNINESMIDFVITKIKEFVKNASKGGHLREVRQDVLQTVRSSRNAGRPAHVQSVGKSKRNGSGRT